MACAATNTSVEIMRGKLIPGGYLIENFKSLIGNQDLGRAFRILSGDIEEFINKQNSNRG